ncbi:MAG: DUF1449 family protein [Planctomycetota bacterium]|nr:DUF1449 family protein [Planctomycetota bacterium]
MQLLELHNVILALPLLVAVLLVLGMALGIPFMHHDVHAAGFHVADTGALGDHGPHLHGDAPAGEGWFIQVLSFLGIGRVPFMMTLLSWFMIWGSSGLIINQARPRASDHLVSTVLMCLVLELTGTGWVARMIARLLPSVESYATVNEQLKGARGDVLHDVTESGGTVRLLDASGNLRDVSVILRPGQRDIGRGEEVVLGRFDAAREVFEVEVLEMAGSREPVNAP